MRSRPFSDIADDNFRDALRKLKKFTPEKPNRWANLKLLPKSGTSSEHIPVPMIGSGGVLDGQKLSMRQLRLSKQINTVLDKELMRSRVGGLVEITEVSLSKDLRNVTVWWQLDDPEQPGDESRTTAVPERGFHGSWIRRPKLSKMEQKVSAWLKANTAALRFTVTGTMPQLKYSPELCFRCDHALAHRHALDSILPEEFPSEENLKALEDSRIR